MADSSELMPKMGPDCRIAAAAATPTGTSTFGERALWSNKSVTSFRDRTMAHATHLSLAQGQRGRCRQRSALGCPISVDKSLQHRCSDSVDEGVARDNDVGYFAGLAFWQDAGTRRYVVVHWSVGGQKPWI